MADTAFKHRYHLALLTRIAEAVTRVYPKFDQTRFLKLAPELEKLEMKDRVRHIRKELQSLLPNDYLSALKILLASAESRTLQDFDFWPYTEFIQTYGLDHPGQSLAALKRLTKLFTAEFAVRPFLTHFPDSTLKFLVKCSRDENVDVRRWSSEGSRPRLPWGERLPFLIKHPELSLPILENLKVDPELYVRKSVSNHLNDLAKDHPEFVIKTLARWKKEVAPSDRSKIEWTTHRALRTLIKAGHPAALRLMGVKPLKLTTLKKLKLSQATYRVSEKLKFNFELHSKAKHAQKLVVDYVIHFKRANGSHSRKVFKLKTFTLAPEDKQVFQKEHSLKIITTRVYYPGEHWLEIQVNGENLGRVRWQLVALK